MALEILVSYQDTTGIVAEFGKVEKLRLKDGVLIFTPLKGKEIEVLEQDIILLVPLVGGQGFPVIDQTKSKTETILDREE